MISPLIAAYLVSVGVLIMAAGHAAVLSSASRMAHAGGAFAATCLGYAGFQFCNALQYSAQDLAGALAAHRWANLFSLLVIPLVSTLSTLLDQRTPRWLPLLILLPTCAAVAWNFINPCGYRFDDLTPMRPLELPWHEPIRILSGEPSLAYLLVRLLSGIVVLHLLWLTIRVARRGDRLAGSLLVGGILMVLLTTSLAGLSDSGLLRLPYLGGFGFVFLAAALTLLVRRELLLSRLEERRSSRALAKEMKQRERADERAEQALFSDPATGLPNRTGILLRLDRLLASDAGRHSRFAVFRFAIERLGTIGASHGLEAADAVMAELGKRLHDTLRESDLVGRVSHDGFIVVASDLKLVASVPILHDKLCRALTLPVELGTRAIRVVCTSGMAICPDDGERAEEILAAAELALHAARSEGSQTLKRFDPSLRSDLQESIDFENALRDALGKNEFFLCYQPQVAASDGRTVCVEALLRWQHPERGLVMPASFVPLAESMGLIIAIGYKVIEMACAQLASWHAVGIHGVRMAVNLSAQQLSDPALADRIGSILRRHGLRSTDLELEITESALMHEPDAAIARLRRLRAAGIRLSIDDFGTGYSSLSQLRLLPVHAFKLDRSFVNDMENDARNFELCATAVGLARKLRLDIVAEGIETEAQANMLRDLGYPLFQGYLFARPLSVDAATDWLRKATLASRQRPGDTRGLMLARAGMSNA